MKRNSVHETVFSDRSREPRRERSTVARVTILASTKPNVEPGCKLSLTLNIWNDLVLGHDKVIATIEGDRVHLDSAGDKWRDSYRVTISLKDFRKVVSLNPEPTPAALVAA